MTDDSEPEPNLVKIPPPARPVMLKSGGPPMNLVCVEGGNAMVEMLPAWTADGKGWRRVLPLACLYACVPLPEFAPWLEREEPVEDAP